MKKLIAILLISIHLFSSTAAKELLKSNILIEHFYETKSKGNPVTFFHFIVMHYLTDDMDNNDNEKDKQLPFKSAAYCTLENTPVFMPVQTIPILAAQYFLLDQNNFSMVKGQFAQSNYHLNIWNPPKFA